MEHGARLGPLGVFDSGLGGLSVLREIRALLPAEDVLYYADCAHCPYGDRSPEYILARSAAVIDALLARGAKLIVVACNTATSVALMTLRQRFDVPIVGMVPAVKPAVAATRSGKIGVLATPRTATGEMLAALIRDHARQVVVYPVPAPGLVDLVEAGVTEGPAVEAALRPLIGPLMEKGVDTLVLGCTHYPFLRQAMRDLAGPAVTMIDSGEAVARRTRDMLEIHGVRGNGARRGAVSLLTSGVPDQVGAVVTRLLGETLPVRSLPL